MPNLTIEIPDVVARRLEALATVSSKNVDQLALEALDSFAGSVKSRRAILKAWRNAAQIAGTSYSLADLGWVDGYSGQTVDELLLFEGTEEVRRNPDRATGGNSGEGKSGRSAQIDWR
jgi:hypothetical protein